MQTLEARGVDGYVALGREGKRAVAVDPGKYPARSRMRKKLASLAGQVAYARRKWIAEAPHGWIKEGLGFRRFSLRGLQSVQGEWDLVCLALNIKRMSALMAARSEGFLPYSENQGGPQPPIPGTNRCLETLSRPKRRRRTLLNRPTAIFSRSHTFRNCPAAQTLSVMSHNKSRV